MLVDFCDIETEALDNCVENLHINFHEEDKPVQGHSILSRERYNKTMKYSLVFANILENILELEAELLYDSLKTGGYLILSGLLSPQVKNISNLYSNLSEKKLKLIDKKIKGEWASVMMIKE